MEKKQTDSTLPSDFTEYDPANEPLYYTQAVQTHFALDGGWSEDQNENSNRIKSVSSGLVTALHKSEGLRETVLGAIGTIFEGFVKRYSKTLKEPNVLIENFGPALKEFTNEEVSMEIRGVTPDEVLPEILNGLDLLRQPHRE